MKISIFGAGNVGAACGFASLCELKPDELILVDVNGAIARGEALDLAHAAVAISPRTKIIGNSDAALVADSDFVVITAGKASKGVTPDASFRDALYDTNVKVISAICEVINKYAPKATTLMVTNPSTKLTKIAKSICVGPIVAMANQLDTARLKYYLNKEANLDIDKIKSYIYGEHGANMQLELREELDKSTAEKVKKYTRDAAIEIITLKGYTNWGIAAQVVEEIKRLASNSGDAQ